MRYFTIILLEIRGFAMIKKYFCDECGARFAAEEKTFIACPECGCYCTYEDTEQGSAEAVKDMTQYENEIEP